MSNPSASAWLAPWQHTADLLATAASAAAIMSHRSGIMARPAASHTAAEAAEMWRMMAEKPLPFARAGTVWLEAVRDLAVIAGAQAQDGLTTALKPSAQTLSGYAGRTLQRMAEASDVMLRAGPATLAPVRRVVEANHRRLKL